MLPQKNLGSDTLPRNAAVAVCQVGFGFFVACGIVFFVTSHSVHITASIMVALAFLSLVILSLMLTKLVKAEQIKRDKEHDAQQEHIAALVHDIVKLKTKLSKHQGALQQVEKMESLGQLAEGVAHEINNPIGFMMSNMCTLKEYIFLLEKLSRQQLALLSGMSKQEKLAHETAILDIKKTLEIEDLDYVLSDANALIDECLSGGARIKQLTTSMKGYEREPNDTQSVSISEQVEQALNTVWNEIKDNCTLNKQLGECPRVNISARSLTHVLSNLLLNASQAMELEPGTLTIKTYTKENKVMIEITDTGCGISRTNISNVFEPFFSTRAIGEGTGLGLSKSYEIIKSYGGMIELSSQVNVGSCFKVSLPTALPD